MVGAMLATQLLVACTTLSTLDGARTLNPGQQSWTLATGLQAGGNALSDAVRLPLPQAELGWRRGLVDNVDVGVRAYLVGVGVDVRYRFLQSGPWHGAFAPGLGGLVLPAPSLVMGAVDLRLPVAFERELSAHSSVAFGPALLAREAITWVSIEDMGRGATARLDVYSGGTARYRVGSDALSLGFGGDLYLSAARRTAPAWSTGVDLRMRSGMRP